MFYRSTTDSSLVQQVSNIVTSNFAGETSVVLSSLLVVTWHHLHANGQPASLVSKPVEWCLESTICNIM